MTYTAVLHKEENMYVAFCPEVGTTSQGKTMEKAVKNLREATELYLEEFPVKAEVSTARVARQGSPLAFHP